MFVTSEKKGRVLAIILREHNKHHFLAEFYTIRDIKDGTL